MHPLEPSTFGYGKLHSWVTANFTAAEALAIFEFMASKSPAAPEMTPSTPSALTPMAAVISPSLASTTSPVLVTLSAPIPLNNPMAPTALMTPAILMAPTAFTPSTHTTSLAFSISTAHTAPILTMAAETLITPTAPTTSPALPSSAPVPSPAPTAPVHLMTSGIPTTSLAKQGPHACRHRFVNPHHVRSTIPCRQESAYM
ncbi:hypothetical protein K440DRAFT_624242 [Wilcoxina mikolae CBS 423.85]|nr:hypothetical protein K440DRAFT_624242 [Wilcoxina mikolae CBS 423.85]